MLVIITVLAICKATLEYKNSETSGSEISSKDIRFKL